MKGRLLAAVLGLAVAASGCIGAAQHRGEPLAGWPPPAGPKPLAVNLVAVVDERQVGGVMAGVADPDGDMKRGVRRALEESRGIQVSEGAVQGWDRRAVFSTLTKTKDEGKSAASAIFCGFTLFLSPLFVNFDVQMTAKLYDGDGKELGVYFQRGDSSLYCSLLFFWAWAVWPTSKAYEDECYELTRRIILDARRAGAL
jgi:hypothetical protein